MKIRILSDVHYDPGINGNGKFDEKYSGQFQKADINLLAGDIAVLPERTTDFLEKFIGESLCYIIGGNHIEYRSDYRTHREIIKEYQKTFPLNHAFYRFLENDYQFIPGTDNSVAVIGSIFYTDYKLCTYDVDAYNNRQTAWDLMMNSYGLHTTPSKPIKKLTKKLILKENLLSASSGMNDFAWGHITKTRHLSPEDYLKFHKIAKRKVLECYKKIIGINPKAKVILLTHHCLSANCISEKYKKSFINSSFASDLENWIDTKMPRVRLVVSGHVHERFDFTFGKNNIRYICNPVGYIPHKEDEKEPAFNPNLIVDTDEL